ncbi:MAG: Holliday junction branch migration protein RuvA [Candidatus Komeilibacteria bacterium CG11_big_fil_rev_8_21_14_0_20_36_20]|uniref:Holliday junction branch migration complex subunit RuvA n=1 Tax=Candidatus Komeilibacteria bacterium CG11_big_fil_rev_8_21_14_0_20_36_20 TaxID=1974477 RepID=A0A2H0NCG6_9BACT|nr:MAG: Holliday junction branch migration protein RuvA [Candidatus Komeilibacteria bacterium CG11_big_fil_rev_8_21_14_0_20_36_20]PIR81923.1 MAG: Holliday junction branch migration protein RuvA [Candidatus Komeilibacteria bacterium CG10_big_fil_rev_8_21_14_0_10_36_65]PJC55350.1 MAG: Holliday junction branch migration protein RuvA [Candidatus Komeilibacteria bacterium CG_4_9_14_0_2_um_filter_36_13]
MIAYLKGQILEKTSKSVIILLNNIGYEVFLSSEYLYKLKKGQEVEFFIYSNIKEDAFDLYGFQNLEELDFFKKLISVSGVGPRSAINILSLASVNDLKKAISSEDSSLLQQVSGIGKKTAERLVVELKEKFIVDLSDKKAVGGGNAQVMEALISLGYKDNEIRAIIRDIPAEEKDLSGKIKKALQLLNKQK